MQKLYVIGLLVLFVSGCSSTKSVQTEIQHAASVGEVRCFNLLQLSDQDQILARELLWEALDEVGLYTILDTLKSVSDVRSFRVAAVDDFIHADSLSKVNEQFDFDQMQRVVNALQCGNTRFIITPFAAIHEEQRYFQIRVVNTSVLDEVLQTYAAFWQNWGFVPGSDAETIVTVVEYESRFNRFRGIRLSVWLSGACCRFFRRSCQNTTRYRRFCDQRLCTNTGLCTRNRYVRLRGT